MLSDAQREFTEGRVGRTLADQSAAGPGGFSPAQIGAATVEFPSQYGLDGEPVGGHRCAESE